MLGKDRFKFESPNAIDAGEAPPNNPSRQNYVNRLVDSTRSTRSTSTLPEMKIHASENLFRGEKIKIVDNNSNISGTCRHSSTASGSPLESTQFLEFDDGDGRTVEHDQLPSPEDARLYANAVLMDSFRRRSISSESVSDEDFIALELEEDKPSSSLAVKAWRRPSRRQSAADMRQAAIMMKGREEEDGRRPYICFFPSIICVTLFVAAAVSAIVLVCFYSPEKDNASARTDMPHSTNDDVVDEMVKSPRFLKTIDWLSAHSISNMNDLTTAGTPQFLAAEWIANLDELQEEIPMAAGILDELLQLQEDYHPDMHVVNGNYNYTTGKEQNDAYHLHDQHERFLQRYVLAVMYFATSSAMVQWTHTLSFLSKKSECLWYKLDTGSDQKQYPIGVTCNKKMLVQDIFIPNNNLQGTLPSELSYLRHLELLSLRHNQISGSLPENIGNLHASLQYLDLSKNILSGSLPENVLGRLHGLKALGLMGNVLEGTLPASDFTRLTQLKALDLSFNRFTGHIKECLFNMTDLKFLYMESNQFDDTLDDSFLINLPSLRELTLNNNKFRSTNVLPLHLLSHPQLSLLDLSSNVLEAHLPSSFLANGDNVETPLKILNLRNNRLKGEIPAVYGNESPSLLKLTANLFVCLG
jgi:Leucine-rich repeat (LRR) protein